MKKALVIALSYLLLGATASVAGHFGPAQPLTQPGEFSLGTGFFYYSAEWGGADDVSQAQLYVQGGYGLFRNAEVYAQLGGTNLEIDDIDFKDGYRPFGTLGFRALLLDRKPVSLGAFVQGSFFSDYEDESLTQTMKVESSYEVNGGIALQTVLEGATLYGGPLFYYREADVTAVGVGSGSVEEDGNLGGFIGIRWPLKNRIAIELETQFKTGVSVGGALHYVF